MTVQFRIFTRLLILLLLHKPIQSCNRKAVLYVDNDYKGTALQVNKSTCFNLPSIMAGKVSSISNIEDCVHLYDNFNCGGNYIELLKRYPRKKLSDWKFDNMVKSIVPCPPLSCPLLISEDEGFAPVTLFTQEGFKGIYLDINVSGCTQIPVDYQHQIKSVKTNGSCIQMYNTLECNHQPRNQSIELHAYSPHQGYLVSAWEFPVVKSISRCDYKCRNTSFKVPKQGQVFLFRGWNFRGDNHNFSLLDAECVHLPILWEGVAESIVLGVDTCVILFERRRCLGRQHEINGSVSNLSSINFGGQMRSLRLCNLDMSTTTTTTITERATKITTPEARIIFSSTTTEILTKVENTTEYNQYKQNTKHDSADVSMLLIAVLVVVPLAVVVLSLVVFCTLKYCNPNTKEGGKLSEKEIREFLSGMGIDLLSNSGGSRNANDYSMELLAQNNAYNMDYELARSSIEIDPGAILGSGEFGIVYKGTLALRNEQDNAPSTSTRKTTTVAVKTVNQTSGSNGIRSLLKEVKVMLYMGNHDNIAKLIGCCTDKIREGDIMVVLEYCSEGSLESYLKKNRSSYNNLVNKGKLDQTSTTSTEITEADKSKFDTNLITKWSLEIARGMEFLSNANVVHSDLAARNILLNDKLEAKISDFGLSRQLYAYSQYMKKHQEPLPFRWMALESLKCLEFSTKSDVWSYGVLIWEIFSLGEKPYPGLGWNEAFISNLESGLRLAKPKNSTNEFYNLMLRCWDENPAERPSFTGIVEEIQEMQAGFQSDA